LKAVNDAWGHLPEAMRQTILLMVENAPVAASPHHRNPKTPTAAAKNRVRKR
jgi:hypothetical protein